MVDNHERDAALLRDIQGRETGALAHLYDHYSRLAFGLAYRILGDSSVAEEVVQDAFMNVWRQATSFDPQRGAVRSWLLSIVHHRAIDRLRSRASQRGDVTLDLVERTMAVPDTWHAVAATLQRDEVRQALRQLPPDQQRTIEMAYFAGMSHSEIAAAMDVPLGTVKGRLRLALRKLRDLLADPTP